MSAWPQPRPAPRKPLLLSAHAQHVVWGLPRGGLQAKSGGPLAHPPARVSPVPPERDSTVAVIVGASVGGFLAMVILALVVVKCLRRRKQQKLNTDDQKTEEEGKTDGEGNPEEGPK